MDLLGSMEIKHLRDAWECDSTFWFAVVLTDFRVNVKGDQNYFFEWEHFETEFNFNCEFFWPMQKVSCGVLHTLNLIFQNTIRQYAVIWFELAILVQALPEYYFL